MSPVLLGFGQSLAIVAVLFYVATLIALWRFDAFRSQPKLKQDFERVSNNTLIGAWVISLFLIVVGDLLR